MKEGVDRDTRGADPYLPLNFFRHDTTQDVRKEERERRERHHGRITRKFPR